MLTINTEKAPAAVGPYSQAVVSHGMVYTSGQIAIDPATNTIKGTTIEEQTEQIMKNLAAVLEEANSGFHMAVKTTCFLADMNDFAAFNEIYGRYFTSLPARSCVAVRSLPKGVLAEVEVIAEVSDYSY
ncbi:RidA family protein [uncultured Ruminococcus sp.]|jgi:2-iminobutanoate/2-iminopropanoate deaminase|uniref:RidA family protein n=1 Tax=uncultured Ruminococcus sp. TaxID=165186 RepID=UPI0025DB5476|nr:RidA family protein [uncultured Ruminococcus sp.]